MPPPPVFHALFLSFHVSLPRSPGLGITYHRHNSLPVRASSAATQPRVPASPAPFAMRTLSSTVIGAVTNLSLVPNSLAVATTLSHRISPVSRLIAITGHPEDSRSPGLPTTRRRAFAGSYPDVSRRDR